VGGDGASLAAEAGGEELPPKSWGSSAPLLPPLSSPQGKYSKRKSRFKRSDGSTSSDTTSNSFVRQVSEGDAAVPGGPGVLPACWGGPCHPRDGAGGLAWGGCGHCNGCAPVPALSCGGYWGESTPPLMLGAFGVL